MQPSRYIYTTYDEVLVASRPAKMIRKRRRECGAAELKELVDGIHAHGQRPSAEGGLRVEVN